MNRTAALILMAITGLGSALGSAQGAPWIQQDRWMVLGPIENPIGCAGDNTSNPTPGHDLGKECPGPFEDWKGEIPFVDNALTSWTELELLGVGRGDVVDFQALAESLGARAFDVKALAVVYAENSTDRPLDVGVCTASDSSIQVWLNDRVVTAIGSCRAFACDCAEIRPATLLPGKNKIAVTVWQGTFGWGFRMRLIRPEGSSVDDRVDSDEVTFTTDPTGCDGSGGLFQVTRSLATINGCPSTQEEVQVKLLGNGTGNPDDPLTVTETIVGQAVPEEISNGGIRASYSSRPTCNFDPLDPVGDRFSDHRDLGAPCASGDTTLNGPGLYTVTGAGEDIWSCGDQFQYAYTRLRGDFSLTAHVAARLYPDGAGGFRSYPAAKPPSRWGKFGLMARDDCSHNSRYAFLHDSSPNQDPPVDDGAPPDDGPDPDSIAFAGRPTHHGDDNFQVNVDSGLAELKHADYLRLSRDQNVFTGWVSSDGQAWTKVGEMDWGPAAPCEVLAGLAVGSHAGCKAIRIQFDQVAVDGGEAACPTAPPVGTRITWNVKRSEVNTGLSYSVRQPGTFTVIGNDGAHTILGEEVITVNTDPPAPVGPDFTGSLNLGGVTGGSITYDHDTEIYTQTGSGFDYWNLGDTAHLAFREVVGDFEFTAQVLSRGTTDPDNADPAGRWGRHGLLARKDCSSNSKYTFLYEYLGSRTTVDDFNSPDWPRLQSRLVHHTNATTIDDLRFDYSPDQQPGFLKLVRHQNTFYGYLSRDGAEWRPLGSDTWQGQDPEAPVLVGFTTQKHGSHQRTPVVKFKVLHLGPIDPPLPQRIPDEGNLPATEVYSTAFNDLDAFQVQHRDGTFSPKIVAGRLRMEDVREGASATSAFRKVALTDIDSAIYQFDFDVFFSWEDVGFPIADGLTFTVTGGRDARRVGLGGGAMGYHHLGRDVLTNENLSNNSFAVEFDSWSNSEGLFLEGSGSPGNPRKFHLGIDATNTVFACVNQTSEDLPDIFDPAGVHARVRYNRGQVSVSLASNAPGAAPLKEYLKADLLPISFRAPDQTAVFGFTGGTGAGTQNGDVDNLRVTRFGLPQNWVRCDSNGDRERDISDPVFILTFLFAGGAASGCAGAVDCNSDGVGDISDAVFDLSFQFLGGPAPEAPYPSCDNFRDCPVNCP